MKKLLHSYHEKRNFNSTPEPIGTIKHKSKKLHFVVQHHLARKDHYDFRLEWNGVLKSWAVPKGPSYNPMDRRLAVCVEDHPFDYRNFEGVIPKGEYGAGPVMLWDEGFFEPIGDFQKGLQKGNLKFILKGSRLHGAWSLIHFKENHWLLIKEKDNFLGFRNISIYDRSVRTGRTMEEIQQEIKIQTSKENAIVQNISVTHPDKVIFSNPKITKLDIALYYEKVAKRMFPFLQHRLISTIRCPKGINGEKFFKKHFQEANSNLGMIPVINDKGVKRDYYYLKNTSALISEVQMNGYEFHIWGSEVSNLNHPDMLVFDLDPDEGMSLKQIRQGVRDLKSLLDELSLISFLKTSGGKGYHIVVPIHSLKTWKSFRNFAQNIAKFMEEKWPDKYVSNVRKKDRKNKIFIDWIRNTKSATSVAPYSIRTRKGAKVSMPISWKELDKVNPDGISMQEAIQSLTRKDPWENFFQIDQ